MMIGELDADERCDAPAGLEATIPNVRATAAAQSDCERPMYVGLHVSPLFFRDHQGSESV